MKFVKIKYKYLFFIVLLFTACKNDKSIDIENTDKNLYYFDVVGNSSIDTIIVENSNINKLNKSISVFFNGKKSLLCEIAPRIDSSFTKVSPKIENIYLEANNVQTNAKGLRVLSRNTDIQPEYFFIDLYFNNEWMVKQIGFLDISSQKPFICKKSIQIKIKKFNGLIINPKDLNQKYFNGNYCN